MPMIHDSIPSIQPGEGKSPGRDFDRLKVVLFSGGRGSTALTRQLAGNERIDLKLVINGYDDGLSTGEVRRFLGDSLGPSDFRKNATRLAAINKSCDQTLIDILDMRFPVNVTATQIAAFGHALCEETPDLATTIPETETLLPAIELFAALNESNRRLLTLRYCAFSRTLETGGTFDFRDCSIGNLIFAGSFLLNNREFNKAVEDYCNLLSIEPDTVLNVTTGENAFLVALDTEGVFLDGEAEIVNADSPSRIDDFFLVNAPLSTDTRKSLAGNTEGLRSELTHRSVHLQLNHKVADAIRHADLIIYAPGTQYSSMYPSYITPGLGRCIAGNIKALKLLVTNLQEDAETRDASAAEIIERALFYLRVKDRDDYPAPCLITHYLVNTPGKSHTDYIPPGEMDNLEDPRLIRIGNYEDGVSGTHHADKILAPFIDTLLAGRIKPQVAVLLLDNQSLDKATQTILELVRGRIESLPCEITVYYAGDTNGYIENNSSMPFHIRVVDVDRRPVNEQLLHHALADKPEFVCLFESSGMYHGHDIVSLVSNLNQEHLDAAWGSRRLSVEDIHASYRFRYRHKFLEGLASYFGSHLLSLSYLLCYGRYMSDTLSGIRLIRRHFLERLDVSIDDACYNQYLLSALLAAKGKVFEVPVDFIPMSPEKVKRTRAIDGLRSLSIILRNRFRRSG